MVFRDTSELEFSQVFNRLDNLWFLSEIAGFEFMIR